jgi:hypothetical protein
MVELLKELLLKESGNYQFIEMQFIEMQASDMWRFVGTAANERNFLIEGVNVWAFRWQEVRGERAAVEDPHYHQSFNFSVYTVTDGEHSVKFAAGEFSNGVWGFYVPGWRK